MNTIIYRELSSICDDLGFSAKTLYSVSNSVDKHYYNVKIPKKNGEFRSLSVPDELLKSIQRKINVKLLSLETISQYAKAYKTGGNTVSNSIPHIKMPIVLKLDIRNFFDNLIYPIVKEKAFPKSRYSEENRILLSLLCTYNNAIPQGAPTSPTISNIVMNDFDNCVGEWCSAYEINYTRYCDDMTFSGDFNPDIVIAFVKDELKKLGLYLNERKTVVAKNGKRQIVTGIVVNEKKSVPVKYKKQIRQEMYYCMRYGINSHIEKIGATESSDKIIKKLSGKVNYVLSVEPDNKEMQLYKKQLKQIK